MASGALGVDGGSNGVPDASDIGGTIAGDTVGIAGGNEREQRLAETGVEIILGGGLGPFVDEITKNGSLDFP